MGKQNSLPSAYILVVDEKKLKMAGKKGTYVENKGGARVTKRDFFSYYARRHTRKKGGVPFN